MSGNADWTGRMGFFATANTLGAWAHANVGKMCSGDTGAVNDPRALAGSEGRPLPPC